VLEEVVSLRRWSLRDRKARGRGSGLVFVGGHEKLQLLRGNYMLFIR
jgi:hypothetical protein